MKLSVIIGTRPEIIKMSPVIRELKNLNKDYFILHTGQHYSYNLDNLFFKELELPRPKYNLNIGSGTHAESTGRMLMGIGELLEKEKPDAILVQGDTNTVLAGALAASKLHIKIAHVEAGLRSNDKNMPEEINRILTDHISDLLFAPTSLAKENLEKENISPNKILVTGNTIVDAVYQNLRLAQKNYNIFLKLNLDPKKYFLVTTHRQENVDSFIRFKNILSGLELLYKEYALPIIFPIHPRSLKRITEFKLEIPEGIEIINPLGFLDFLLLEANANLILTDSGGIQEESCILKVPCITLRNNTERPETINVGSNILSGTDPNQIYQCGKIMLNRKHEWINPFGLGNSGEKIVKAMENVYE